MKIRQKEPVWQKLINEGTTSTRSQIYVIYQAAGGWVHSKFGPRSQIIKFTDAVNYAQNKNNVHRGKGVGALV